MKDVVTGTGIVYYSRTGHSKRVAEALATRLDGSLYPVEMPAYAGAFGMLRAIFDSLRGHIVSPEVNISSMSSFERVLICGPVWTSYPATPVRALLRTAHVLPVNVGLCLTSGSRASAQKALEVAEADFGRSFKAKAMLANPEEGTAEESRILDEFCAAFGVRA
jgi:hypothetical protein